MKKGTKVVRSGGKSGATGGAKKRRTDDGAPAAAAAPARRYAPAVEKGEAAWKQEWGGFISNVKMSGEGTKVDLKPCMDYEASGTSTFSYLFSSPSQKKKEMAGGGKTTRAAGGGDAQPNPKSKYHDLLKENIERGVKMEGMNRSEKRKFLRISVTEEIQEAEEFRATVKPHELMDPKLQWYQQCPYPLDVVSEKLVTRNALKKGKKEGLRYNYHLVHPSWVASRARKRRELKMDHTGKRTRFEDDS